MKTQSGRLTRRRKHFARLYDDNSEWREEHQDMLVVFHKIARLEKRTGDHPLTIIKRLAQNPTWASRLKNKRLRSWKVNYNRWKRNHSTVHLHLSPSTFHLSPSPPQK